MKLANSVYLWGLLFAIEILSRPTTVVPISDGEVVRGTVGDGRTFSLAKPTSVSTAMLKMILSSNAKGDEQQVQVHVQDQDGIWLGEVVSPDPEGFSASSRLLCNARGESIDSAPSVRNGTIPNITAYTFNVLGTPGAEYSIQPVYENNELDVGGNSIHATSDGFNSTYWYFDINVTHAPAEVTVYSDTGDEATLRTVLKECSFLSVASTLRGGVVHVNSSKFRTAFMSFKRQTRLSINERPPGLQAGRWYLSVTPASFKVFL